MENSKRGNNNHANGGYQRSGDGAKRPGQYSAADKNGAKPYSKPTGRGAYQQNGAKPYTKTGSSAPRSYSKPYAKTDEKRYNAGAADTAGAEASAAYAIVGRNAVLELLKSGRDIDKIFVQKTADREAQGGTSGSLPLIVGEARGRAIPVIEVEKQKLDELSEGVPHQGVAALAPERDYNTLDDIMTSASQRGEKPVVVIADGIEDPHNLGAIIRVAEGSGAHGVIIPKRRSSPMTQVVSKASAGAVEYMNIVKVPNLAQTVRTLKELGFWIFAAEAGGTDYDKCDFDCPCAIILGSEGEGVSRLLREQCDYTVSIPMKGKVNSLNVSTAASVILYEIVRQRAAKN
ncbi:MAG: 23S rRNA (guanosine(2251)-2'-O)-methyltransferase RlmB [Eubacteriales bacterium]